MGKHGLFYAVCVALACIVAIATIGHATTPAVQEPEHEALVLEIDTSNAAQMHKYGLPTREDVMQYHISSRWAYQRDGVTVEVDELPGGYATWYELYGLDKWSDKEEARDGNRI